MVVNKISRDELIDKLVASVPLTADKEHSSDIKIKGLAQTYLTCILTNTESSFSERKAVQIQKGFKAWKATYEATRTEILTLKPNLDGKEIQTHNISSLPNVWKAEQFFSTTEKTKAALEERVDVQENLTKLAKTSFESDTVTIGDTTVEMRLLASLEQLARGYAYHSPEQGEIMEIYSSETKRLEAYEIKLIPLSMGIYAYGLTPTDKNSAASPILLFRGTSFYPTGKAAGETVKTDLHPLGIGYGSYLQGKKAISKWIDEATKDSNKKVLVTGHSLGSAHATYASIDNHDKVKLTCGFGSTKVSFMYYNKWKKVRNNLTILNFNTPGDKLSSFSHVRIATHVIEGTSTQTAEEEIRPNQDVPVEIKSSKIFARVKMAIARKLGKGRKLSIAHRVSYLDKSATLYLVKEKKKHVFVRIVQTITNIGKYALVLPILYMTWSTFFLAKRATIGDDEGGWFSLFRKRSPKDKAVVAEDNEPDYQVVDSKDKPLWTSKENLKQFGL